ncbi:hypothetical protein MLD38_014178 [Melastoma candidum]|uniref:Uncharacterized protein n=1 Tax=Melastoma candidum TaxID=119954 RepID=A0ACB9RG44_9MYRT|nr:hypothetical protein MLD38_014178 [Melastoma candidum]
MEDCVSKVKPFLLNSIARFLETNGFSRTLKKFRSEARFEEDDVKNVTVDLEEMFFKFLGSNNDAMTSNATKRGAKKKSKDKKKKSSRSSDIDVQECKKEGKNSVDNGKSFLDDHGGIRKGDEKNSDRAVITKDDKATKKRKRHTCENKPINGDAVDESSPKCTSASDDLQTRSKKLKASTDNGKSNDVTTKGNGAEAQEVCNGANRSAGTAEEKSANQKSMKKQNGSAEPTSVKAFQRVKVEEVVFSDERLKDNSYWAKDGAETGYGAKAQEVLGQVRGRGFRHEKTKKKRGSYRGGMIDMHSHSVKFNYSDEE